jgi:tetratricopeptide (TPR) repeat protein
MPGSRREKETRLTYFKPVFTQNCSAFAELAGMKTFTLPLLLCWSLQLAAGPKDTARINTLYRKAFASALHSSERQAYLDSVLLIDHTQTYAWQQKAMPLFKQKKYEAGMPFLDSAVKYDKSYRWLEYRAFMKCIFQRAYRAAISDFRLAEKKNPRGIVMDHSYDFYTGLSLLQLNRFDSAEHYVRKSIDEGVARVGEGHHLEQLYLGVIFMELKKLPEAIKWFDGALKAYPRFSDAKYYKALCLRMSGQPGDAQLMKEAAADLKAGYTINEDNVLYEEYPYQVRSYMLQWSNAPSDY